MNPSDEDRRYLESATTTEQLRQFLRSHLRTAVHSLAQVGALTNKLPPGQVAAVQACLPPRSRPSDVSACADRLPADVPAEVRRKLASFGYHVIVAGLIYDVCEHDRRAACPPASEYNAAFREFMPEAMAAAQGAAGFGGADSASVRPLDGAAAGGADVRGVPGGTSTTGTTRPPRESRASGNLAPDEQATLDAMAGTVRFEPPLPQPAATCPFLTGGGCGGSSGAPVLPNGAAQVTDAARVALATDAARYLLRAEAIAYLRQSALIEPLTTTAFQERSEALLNACDAGSALRGELTEFAAAANAVFASGRPADARAMHHAGAIEAAVRLAQLARDSAILAGDFDGPPPSIESRWPGWAPGRTVIQLIDAGGIGFRMRSVPHQACSPFNIGFANTPLAGPEEATAPQTEADRWLVREGFVVSGPSRPSSRCRVKNLLLEANAQTMASLLAQYPVLGEQTGGRPLFQVMDGLSPDEAAARLQRELDRRDNPVLQRMRESVGRLCRDPAGAGETLFGDDAFLRNFLSCGGRAPVPVDPSASETPGLDARCREIRSHAAAACVIRDRVQTRQGAWMMFTGTLGVGLDVLGVYSLGAGAVRGLVARTLFADIGRQFTRIGVGTAAGAGLGIGMAYYQMSSATETAEDETARYYAGISDLARYTRSVEMASESRRHAIRDAVIALALGQALGGAGGARAGAEPRPLLTGNLRDYYLQVLRAPPSLRRMLLIGFGRDMRAELARRFGLRPADLARMTDEDLFALAEANGGLSPRSAFRGLQQALAACGSDPACHQHAIDVFLFGPEHAGTVPQAPAAAPAGGAAAGGGAAASRPPTARVGRPASLGVPGAPQRSMARVTACCSPVSSGQVPAGIEVPAIGDPQNPYYSGPGIAPSPASAPAGFRYSPPAILRGRAVADGLLAISDEPVGTRLEQALPRGRNARSNATYAGRGAQSNVYYSHGDLPAEVWSAIDAAPDEATALAIRQSWAMTNARSVLKIRSPRPWGMGIGVAAEQMRRDLAVGGLADELSARATYDGGRLVRTARILSSDTQHMQGVIEQEAVAGVTVSRLQRAVDRLNPRTATNASSMGEAEARQILGQAGLSWEEAQGRIHALEEFYRRTHADVIAFQNSNGFRIVPLGRLRAGRSVPVGFDYNNGQNVIWNASERTFVMIDW
jgi:hypothetical protein